jgi:hypothetical protein
MIRPAFAPVPTTIEAESPAALIATVAVAPANEQLTAASAVGAETSSARMEAISAAANAFAPAVQGQQKRRPTSLAT